MPGPDERSDFVGASGLLQRLNSLASRLLGSQNLNDRLSQLHRKVDEIEQLVSDQITTTELSSMDDHGISHNVNTYLEELKPEHSPNASRSVEDFGCLEQPADYGALAAESAELLSRMSRLTSEFQARYEELKVSFNFMRLFVEFLTLYSTYMTYHS